MNAVLIMILNDTHTHTHTHSHMHIKSRFNCVDNEINIIIKKKSFFVLLFSFNSYDGRKCYHYILNFEEMIRDDRMYLCFFLILSIVYQFFGLKHKGVILFN